MESAAANESQDRQLCVTARELARCVASVLDQIDSKGRAIVISRYGKAVAMIGPLPNDWEPGRLARFRAAPRYEDYGDPRDPSRNWELTEDDLSLIGEIERAVLEAVHEEAPNRWMLTAEPVSWLRAVGRLDLAGMVEKVFGGWRENDKGRRALETLRGAAR